MRKLLLILSLVVLSVHITQAQDCNTYFPLIKGAVYEQTNYDGSSKLTSRVLYTVKDVVTTATSTEATFFAQNYDKKDQIVSEGEYKVICKGNVVSIDMKSFMMNNPSMSAYKDMDVTMSGDFLEFPGTLKEGMTLPDAHIEVVVSDKKTQAEMARMKMNIVNRKVVGKTSITTPTGTYEAWKITQETTGSNTVMTMNINMPTMYTVDYIVVGTGIVKSEIYDDKNKLKGYSLKTK